MSTPASAPPPSDAANASPSIPSTNAFPSFSPMAGPSSLPVAPTSMNAQASGSSSSAANGAQAAFNAMMANGNMPQVPPMNEQQTLQARLLLAQQVLQASQAQAQANAGTSGQAPAGPPDRAAFQYTLEKLSNMQGVNKEAMMKQLQAIQNSQAQRLRSASGGSQAGAAGGTAVSPTATVGTPSFTAPSPHAPSPIAHTPSSTAAALSGMSPAAILNGGQRGSIDSISAPSPAAQQPPTPSMAMPPLPGGLNWETLTQPQRDFIMAQYKLRAQQMQGSTAPDAQTATAPTPTEPPASTPQTAPTPSAPLPQTPIVPLSAPSPAVSTPATATSVGPPKLPTPAGAAIAAAVRPGQPAVAAAAKPQPTNQKQQFLQSLTSYYRYSNQQAPAELFQGDLKAAVRICGVVIELVELFIAVARAGNSATVIGDPEHSFLYKFATAKGLPIPLPEPYQLPRPPGLPAETPDKTTTDPAQALIGVYQAYLYGFEQHMARTRQAQVLKAQQLQQQQAAGGAVRPPAIATAGTDGTAPITAPSPALPTPITAPSPAVASAPAPASADAMAPPPAFPPSAIAGPSTQPDSNPLAPGALKRKSRDSVIPPALQANGSSRPGSAGTSGSGEGKKRKKGTSTGSSTPVTAAAPVVAEIKPEPAPPPKPKRARYKVEYRPLHHPPSQLAGWDERMVSLTFPKSNLARHSRSVHELQVVDMESVLMGLRSRLPKELGYCLTVLAMLSMPHPEENIPGLPLQYLRDIYMEILELIEEAAFGVEGYDAWLKGVSSEDATSAEDVNRMSFVELEELGKDNDYSFDLNGIIPGTGDRSSRLRSHSRTGGSTDIVLACLNLLRNFSMMPDNQGIMTTVPETFSLLSRICDARLARLPLKGVEHSDKPYSVLELARVRRDVVVILTNLGQHFDLRKCTPEAILSVVRLLSSFINSAWESLNYRESPFGVTVAVPVTTALSVNRALEAWSKLSLFDSNREILGRIIPSEEQLALFQGLIRLFPSSKRASAVLHSQEEYLTFVETLSLSLYSLVFLASLHTRAAMRSLPGATALLSRLIFDTAGTMTDFRANAFNVLCRRLCETMGVLNGTVSASGGVESVSFSAASEGGNDKGWSFTNKTVEQGWLAGKEEKVIKAMMVHGLDMPAFMELDKLCWATHE